MRAAEQLHEQELVHLCRDGNPAAFEELVRRNISSVSSTAFALTGNSANTDDITQETFLLAWQKLDQLNDPIKLRSWLCTITRNLAKTAYRRSRLDPLSSSTDLSPELATNRAARPDTQAMAAERNRIVWSAIENIPEEYRLPLVLYYRDGQSTAQVAQALDISELAVRQRLSRARGMLRRDIAAIVEDSLGTSPSQALLVTSIVATVFGGASSVSVAGLAAATGTVAKAGSAGGTGLGATGLSGVAAAGLLGPAIGIAGGYIGARQSLRGARTPEERKILKRMIVTTSLVVLVWLILLGLLVYTSARAYIGPGKSVVYGTILLAAYIFSLVWIIVRTNGRIRQLRLDGGYMTNEPPITSEQQAAVNPRQWLKTLIFSMGGAVFGSLSWLLVMAALSQEYLLFGATLLAGAVIVGIATVCGMKNPANYFLHAAAACLGVAVYTVLAGWISWSPAISSVYRRHNNIPGLDPEEFLPLTVAVAVLMAAPMLRQHIKRRRGRP